MSEVGLSKKLTKRKEMSVTNELLQAMSQMIADAIRASTPGTSAENRNMKPPAFKINEYRAAEGETVEDYFNRFNWALQLSKIPQAEYADYARVNMGSELNNALKFLINPRLPQQLTYEELRNMLVSHFDHKKNKCGKHQIQTHYARKGRKHNELCTKVKARCSTLRIRHFPG